MSVHRNSVFIPTAKVGPVSAKAAPHAGRIRMGEIFMIQDHVFEFVCFHCSKEFHDFGDFTFHANEHLLGIASMLSSPSNKRAKRSPTTEQSNELKVEDIDPNDVFAGIDIDMDYSQDSDEIESLESVDEDDTSYTPAESEKSFTGIDHSVVVRLAKKNFELDGSKEAIEYSQYIYDHRFRNVKGSFKCPKCSYSSKKHDHVRRHIYSHLRRKIFKCKTCSIHLSHFIHVSQHHQFHQDEEANKDKHNVNETKSADVQNLENQQFREVKTMLRNNAIEIKSTPETDDYLGYLCGRKTLTKENGKYTCPKCTYFSEHPNHVKRHVATHFKRKMFTCLKCHKQIDNVENCRKHMNLIHGMKLERFNFTAMHNEAEDTDDDSEPGQEPLKSSSTIYDPNESVQCDLCGKAIEKQFFDSHMTTAHRNT